MQDTQSREKSLDIRLFGKSLVLRDVLLSWFYMWPLVLNNKGFWINEWIIMYVEI